MPKRQWRRYLIVLMGTATLLAGFLVVQRTAVAQQPTVTPLPSPTPTAQPTAPPNPTSSRPTPLPASTGWPVIPGRPTPAPGTPAAVTRVVQVRITVELLERFLQDELFVNREYLAAVRASQGPAAAAQEEARITAPYRARIAQLRERGRQGLQTFDTEDIPMTCLYDSFCFSKLSYESAGLNPKDPVSMLWFGDADKYNIYNRIRLDHTCWPHAGTCQNFRQFIDEDARSSIPLVACSSSAQWVFMGNAGLEPADWMLGDAGLMKSDDSCNIQARDHMRIHGSVQHPALGWWSVGTPHHEQWCTGYPGSCSPQGHVVDDWDASRNLFAGSWVEHYLGNDYLGYDPRVLFWSSPSFLNVGVYQGVGHDGNGFVFQYDAP